MPYKDLKKLKAWKEANKERIREYHRIRWLIRRASETPEETRNRASVSAAYRNKHRDRYLQHYKNFRLKNPDYHRKWVIKNKELVSAKEKVSRKKPARLRSAAEQMRKWRSRNPGAVRAINKKAYAKYRDKRLAGARVYYLSNRDLILERGRQWRLKNLELAKERVRRYAKNNPHVNIASSARRRAKISATIDGSKAVENFIRLIRGSEWVECRYCKKMIPGKKAHIDHVIPLSRGGHHRVENLSPSCPGCNLSKGARLPHEWSPTFKIETL